MKSTLIDKVAGYLWRRYATAKSALPEISDEDIKTMKMVRPFTLTSWERIYSTITAIRYIVENRIPGDIVECGVWKGGSMMAVARTLRAMDDTQRDIYLYDTFAGMTKPSIKDKSAFGKLTPMEEYSQRISRDGKCHWCYSPIEETRRNMVSMGYPEERVHFVRGPVKDDPTNNAG